MKEPAVLPTTRFVLLRVSAHIGVKCFAFAITSFVVVFNCPICSKFIAHWWVAEFTFAVVFTKTGSVNFTLPVFVEVTN